jgi:hypothetical protein
MDAAMVSARRVKFRALYYYFPMSTSYFRAYEAWRIGGTEGTRLLRVCGTAVSESVQRLPLLLLAVLCNRFQRIFVVQQLNAVVRGVHNCSRLKLFTDHCSSSSGKSLHVVRFLLSSYLELSASSQL